MIVFLRIYFLWRMKSFNKIRISTITKIIIIITIILVVVVIAIRLLNWINLINKSRVFYKIILISNTVKRLIIFYLMRIYSLRKNWQSTPMKMNHYNYNHNSNSNNHVFNHRKQLLNHNSHFYKRLIILWCRIKYHSNSSSNNNNIITFNLNN